MAALQLVALVCIMFLALGIFNILMMRRRQQRERMQGIQRPWYRQMSVLTSIEYVLLALAFLLNLSLQYHWLPVGLNMLVIPTFVLLLLVSGLLAGAIIFQSIENAKQRRTLATANAHPALSSHKELVREKTPAERVAAEKRKRERRHKAAVARRRSAGKAR